MKHEWLMNSKLWTVAFMVLFAALMLGAGILTMGQAPDLHGPATAETAKTTPDSLVGGKAKPSAPVPLTADEEKDWEINSLQGEKLELEIQGLMRQINDARTNHQKETSELTARLLAAHKLDGKKWAIDAKQKAFVPVGAK